VRSGPQVTKCGGCCCCAVWFDDVVVAWFDDAAVWLDNGDDLLEEGLSQLFIEPQVAIISMNM
jgi:hypothetical protein